MIHCAHHSVYLALLALLPGVFSAAPDEREEGRRTVEALIDAMGESDAEARIQAISEVAELGQGAKPAVSALIRATSDQDDEVRGAAVMALGRLALEPDATIPALVAVLGDSASVGGTSISAIAGLALAGFGRPAVPHLIKALDSENVQVRRGAMAGIYRSGPLAKSAVDRLMSILREDDAQTRRFVLNALIGIGPDAKDAVPLVTEFLGHEDFHTQYWACRVLSAIGPDAQSATDELVQLVSTGVVSVRRHAAMALGDIGPSVGPEAVQALTEALTDFSQHVKQDAVVALGKLKPISSSAAPVIEELLQKPRHFLPRAHAARALWLIRPESESVVVDALLRDISEDQEPWEAVKVLAEIDVVCDVVPRIVPLLQSENLWVRQYAASALGNLGPKAAGARDALKPLLQDEAEGVRVAAAQALKNIAGIKP